MYKKTGGKINVLIRIAPFIGLSKRHILMNDFFISQLIDCLLIWICHNCTNNRKINRFHERFLLTIYNDIQASFSELLENDGFISIYMRYIQSLATAMVRLNR